MPPTSSDNSNTANTPAPLAKLNLHFKRPWQQRLYDTCQPGLERLLGVSTLNTWHADALTTWRDGEPFLIMARRYLNLQLCLDPRDLERIPRTGPLIVVANHPFGGIEGILLAELLHRVRPDWKLMANYLLGRLPDAAERLIMVDPFGGDGSQARNLGPLKQAFGWLRQGGVLGIFPAGEVAHFDVRQRRVVDPPWSETIARIIRRTDVPVLPVFFEGRNGMAFQAAGMVHERLRTALLVRELLKRRDGSFSMRVGNLIPAARLKAIETDADLCGFIRLRTCILENRSAIEAGAPVDDVALSVPVEAIVGVIERPVDATLAADSSPAVIRADIAPDALVDSASLPTVSLPAAVAVPPSASASIPAAPLVSPAASVAPAKTGTATTERQRSSPGNFLGALAATASTMAAASCVARRPGASARKGVAIIDPVPPDVLAAEVADLDPSHILVQSGEMVVYAAPMGEIPTMMREIGRLREFTFRMTGEGTGKAIDLDRFDAWYEHIFIWHRRDRALVGAYRVGKVDEILAAHGREGLYSYTLFHYDMRFHHQVTPALEMGRSFIQPAYQRNYQTLLTLWKGVCRYVVQNPRYRYLFGPVSIASDYQKASHQLIVDYLTFNRFEADLARFVRARTPFRRRGLKGWQPNEQARLLEDEDDASALVADIEQNDRGIPVLLRQYLKLGGRILGFNLDPDFADCLDGLILVDLVNGDDKFLGRLMGRDERRAYLDFQRAVGGVAAGLTTPERPVEA